MPEDHDGPANRDGHQTRSRELVTDPATHARVLTNRIKLLAEGVRQPAAKLSAAIGEARDSGAHIALEYPSWTVYVAAEFADYHLHLDRDDRRELEVSLASWGMSVRDRPGCRCASRHGRQRYQGRCCTCRKYDT